MMRFAPIALAALACGLAGCGEETTPRISASAEEVDRYLRPLASRLAHRPLDPDERDLIADLGGDAIDPIVQTWLEAPPFVDASRDMMEHLLKTSGQANGIDFDLPGNLTAHLVRHELPYSKLLTADYCVDADDERIECDTTAPFVAGVLTTRAYLTANASRFNLRRATTLMSVFSCRGYPMEAELQPPVIKHELIPMFQASTAEEQTVEEVRSGFGNGLGCYTCHSQFAAHAQLFVKFNGDGVYWDLAHGQQDRGEELGRSYGGYFASHFRREVRSSDERGNVFGSDVANLQEAAPVVVAEPRFLECAVRRTFEYAFDIDETQSARTSAAVYAQIADGLREAGHHDPTFSQLFFAVVTDPAIVRGVIEAR